MKKKEMNDKDAKKLLQHAEKLGKELAEMRVNQVTKGEKNHRAMRTLKRERARALTIATIKQNESEEK